MIDLFEIEDRMMDLYELHANPSCLTGYGIALNQLPWLAWNQLYPRWQHDRQVFYKSCGIEIGKWKKASEDDLHDKFLLEFGAPIMSKEYLWATDSYLSFVYSYIVIRRRFILGEPAISTNAHHSLVYATDILESRFTIAEPTIKKASLYWKQYRSKFLKNIDK